MGKWRSKKEVPLDVIERWLKDAERSSGYHFFCTREQAERYGN